MRPEEPPPGFPAKLDAFISRVRALADASVAQDFTLEAARQGIDGLAQATDALRFTHEVERLQMTQVIEMFSALAAQYFGGRVPISSDEGPIEGLASMSVALAEELEASQRALAERKVLLQSVLDSLSEGVVVADTSGRILLLNAGAERLLGAGAEGPEGWSERYGILLPDGKTRFPAAELPLMKATAGLACDDVEMVLESGQFLIAAGRPLLDASGALSGGLMILRDVTERQRARLAAERLAAMTAARDIAEAATVAKSLFLANMSHEIRTPLTALLGFADLLVSPHLGESERLDYAMIIRRNSEHLLSLLNDILDLSKIEAGKLDVGHAECPLSEVLNGVASLMRVRAAEGGIEFGVRLLTPVPAVVRTDSTRLRQILLNLVGNAIKFTRKGSVLVLVRYDAFATPPTLVIDVIDTGVGMSAEQVTRLFQPFQQADPTMNRRFGGTGLGLAICKPLAEALGGVITVRSVLGQGSTFTFTMRTDVPAGTPLLHSMTEHGVAAPPGAQPRLTGSVLLAEDGPDNQVLISAILTKRGLSVVVADDGEAAVARALAAVATGTPFDLVLMDMQMPVLDGYAATNQMRRRGLRVPIIALTAHAMAGERERCLAAGCDAYLSKPVDRALLVETIRRYLNKPGGQPEAEPPTPAAPAPMGGSPTPLAASQALESTFAHDPEIEQLIRLFVDGLPARVEAIRAALVRDRPEARYLSHQLKGAAGGYGFPTITEAAAHVERAVDEGRPAGEIEPLLNALSELSLRARRGAGRDPSMPR